MLRIVTVQGAYSHFTRPWVIGDDFNIVRSTSGKRNCSRSTRYMNGFYNFIEDERCLIFNWQGNLYMDQETSLETSSLLIGSSSSVEWNDMFSNTRDAPQGRTPNLTFSLKIGGWKLNFLVIESYFGGHLLLQKKGQVISQPLNLKL